MGEYKKNKRDGKGIYYHENIYYSGDWVNNMPHGEGKIFVDKKNKINGIFRYGKLVVKEEGKKEKKEKKGNEDVKNSINKIEIIDKFDEKETGAKINSKEFEKDLDKKNGKVKENKVNDTKNKNKYFAPLKNKNKVANPMDYKFGFLEKVKNKK